MEIPAEHDTIAAAEIRRMSRVIAGFSRLYQVVASPRARWLYRIAASTPCWGGWPIGQCLVDETNGAFAAVDQLTLRHAMVWPMVGTGGGDLPWLKEVFGC